MNILEQRITGFLGPFLLVVPYYPRLEHAAAVTLYPTRPRATRTFLILWSFFVDQSA